MKIKVANQQVTIVQPITFVSDNKAVQHWEVKPIEEPTNEGDLTETN